MRRAGPIEILGQFGRNAAFIAQQHAGQQTSLRFGEGLGDAFLRRPLEIEQGRVKGLAIAAADDLDAGERHDGKNALPSQIIGV